MRSAIRNNVLAQLLFILICLMPVIILFLLPGSRIVGNMLLFWLILFLCFSVIWGVLGRAPLFPVMCPLHRNRT